ncbi:MAG: M1 family aminopeptidase, partial [Myxococcales bacterium]
MGGALYYQMMIGRKLIPLLLAAAIAPEESELLAKSLQPSGRAELEGNAAPIEQLPISEVQAELDPSKARVEGQLRLVVRNREAAPWYEVVLRAYPNAARGTSLRVDDVRVDGKRVAARSHGSVIAVPLELLPGQSAAISLNFRGQLRRLKEGDDDPLAAADELLSQVAPGLLAGKSRAEKGYGTFAVGPHGAALVDWYPQLAARAHGVWDREEPGSLGDVGHADPSAAVVALTVPKGWRVAGAGSLLGQHPIAGGKETAAFAAAGIRGALGMAASPEYAEVTEPAGAIELRASSTHGEAGARALLSCGRQALQSLQARFGPYPWTSLALAEAPLTGGAGGVELPGMALIAQALSPQSRAGVAPSGLFEFTCFHEIAHQWWQGLVGSDPRRTPWVDEALAQYSALLVTEDVHGKAAADQALSTYVALNYHGMRMARVADGKVARAADEFRSPLAYAGLVYGKAPLFFEKARALLGDEGFDAASRAYRQAWAFREAGGSAWLDAARRVDPRHAAELSALEKRWW